MRTLRNLAALLTLLFGARAAPALTTWQTTVACGFSGVPGDGIERGFYLTSYSGSNLSQVELEYYSSGVGDSWRITLTAHRGSFDGPVLGTQTTTATANSVNLNGGTFAIFDFGGIPVTPGDTIAFTQTAKNTSAGANSLLFNAGTGNCPNVFETFGTSSPLDTVKRHSVGIVVTQHTPAPTACLASDTVMCIDDKPGDQRFKVTVNFSTSQGGGISGHGQEIPGAPVGIRQGGFFWFFGSANPEMLVKIVNGCGVNGHFWVFLSAGTNAAFDVNVRDTKTGHAVAYHNSDLTAALPVQDTGALACP